MISVEEVTGRIVPDQRVEIVERKGTGHPDTLCDVAMDAISVALCGAYLEQFGTILHHNIDKGLLAAGSAEISFGGGKVVKPMELTIGDRATFTMGDREIPVAEIAVNAARESFRRSLRHLDADRHLSFRLALAPGSAELAGIFGRRGEVRGANDTSAAVGYYPLSATEQAVLSLEHYVNSASFKERFPETGEDVKVMGLRRGRHLEVTVAMPLLASFIRSETDYFARKESIGGEMAAFLADCPGFESYALHYNGLDQKGSGLSGVYLSLLGTSAENADSGQVGRGNRVNGLIAVNRPLGTEAAAGKNPVSHVGKIYNVLAHKLSRVIYEEIAGLREVHTLLLSRIGQPVDRPLMTSVQVSLEAGQTVADVRGQVEAVCERELAGVQGLCMELARGEHPVC